MRNQRHSFKKGFLSLLLTVALLFQTIPMLARSVSAENDFVKLSGTGTGITYQGAIGADRLPSLVVDGDKGSNDMKYFVVGNDQTQVANPSAPANPAYWLQMDLGRTCLVKELRLWSYQNRSLSSLVVLASNTADFSDYSILWNADADNFFGFGNGGDPLFPAATGAGDTITLPSPVSTRYLRFLNNGHTVANRQGAHWYEIEVYGAEPLSYTDRSILDIPTYSANGKDGAGVTHPDVLDFAFVYDASGNPLNTWGGYRYWMAATPNQKD